MSHLPDPDDSDVMGPDFTAVVLGIGLGVAIGAIGAIAAIVMAVMV